MNQLRYLTSTYNNKDLDFIKSDRTLDYRLDLPFGVVSSKYTKQDIIMNDSLFFTRDDKVYTKGFVCFEKYLKNDKHFYAIRLGKPGVKVLPSLADNRSMEMQHYASINEWGDLGMPHILNNSFCLGNSNERYKALRTKENGATDLKIKMQCYSEALYNRNVYDGAGEKIHLNHFFKPFTTDIKRFKGIKMAIETPNEEDIKALCKLFATNSFKCINGTDEDMFLDYISPLCIFDGTELVPNTDLTKINENYLRCFQNGILFTDGYVNSYVTSHENTFHIRVNYNDWCVTVFKDCVYYSEIGSKSIITLSEIHNTHYHSPKEPETEGNQLLF